MKKFYLLFVFAAFFGLFALSTKSASASDYASEELRSSKCAGAVGEAIIDVEQKVKNDADSGVAGNYWALDKYEREIKVWKTTTPGIYCTIVKYDGEFVTFAGFSPNNTGAVGAGIEGDMQGGRRTTIVGTLKSVPDKPVYGNIGTYDYRCDQTGNCPGYVRWLSFYFNPSYSFNDDWWGWKYTTEHNGTWINAITGNTGDITGNNVSDEDEGQNSDNNGDSED